MQHLNRYNKTSIDFLFTLLWYSILCHQTFKFFFFRHSGSYENMKRQLQISLPFRLTSFWISIRDFNFCIIWPNETVFLPVIIITLIIICKHISHNKLHDWILHTSYCYVVSSFSPFCPSSFFGWPFSFLFSNKLSLYNLYFKTKSGFTVRMMIYT